MQPHDPAVGPVQQPRVDDGVVDHVGEPGRRHEDLAAGGRADRDPLGRPLGRGVDLRRVRAQRLAGGRAHDLGYAELPGGAEHVVRPDDVGRDGAVHLHLGQRGRALRGHVEDDVRLDLRDDLVETGAVPDVTGEVFRACLPGIASGETPADADQAAGITHGELGHQRRADAAGSPGDQDGGAVQPVGQLRLRQAEPALLDPEETRVLGLRLGLGREQLCRQLTQPGDLAVIEIRLVRRYRVHHRVNDFLDPTHPVALQPKLSTRMRGLRTRSLQITERKQPVAGRQSFALPRKTLVCHD